MGKISFIVLHLALLVISILLISPKKPGYDETAYSDLFREKCPRLNFSFAGIALGVTCFYGLEFIILKPVVYLNFLENINSYIYIACFAGLIFFLLYKFVFGEELKKNGSELSSLRSLFNISIIVYIYSISVIFGTMFLYSTNHILDFTTPEEVIVTIDRKDTYTPSSSRSGGTQYTLYYTPATYGVYEIKVSQDIYKIAEKGNKLKLTVGSGLFGQKYTKSTFHLLK